MKTSLNEKIKEIGIPETLDTRIRMGFDQAKLEEGIKRSRMKRSLTNAAASAAVLFVTLGLIGFDHVGAAIRNALRYIPGFNILVNKDEGDILVLPEEVEIREGDLFLRLKAAVQSNQRISLSIESNLGVAEAGISGDKTDKASEEWFRKLNLTLKNPDGTTYSKGDWSLGSGGEFWMHNADFEVAAGNTDYVLTAGELSLNFKLSISDGVDSLTDLGPSAIDKDITVVGLRRDKEDELHISLVSSSKNGIITSYPMGEESLFALFGSPFILESIHLKDIQGKKIYPEIPSSYGGLLSSFIFNAESASDYTLVLPYMEMSYPEIQSDKITLSTPEDGETRTLDKSVQLGKFTVDVLEIRREGDDVTLKLASKPLPDEVLSYFTIDGVGGYGMSYDKEPLLHLSLKNVGQKFSMRLKNPQSLLKGEWIIELPEK